MKSESISSCAFAEKGFDTLPSSWKQCWTYWLACVRKSSLYPEPACLRLRIRQVSSGPRMTTVRVTCEVGWSLRLEAASSGELCMLADAFRNRHVDFQRRHLKTACCCALEIWLRMFHVFFWSVWKMNHYRMLMYRRHRMQVVLWLALSRVWRRETCRKPRVSWLGHRKDAWQKSHASNLRSQPGRRVDASISTSILREFQLTAWFQIYLA